MRPQAGAEYLQNVHPGARLRPPFDITFGDYLRALITADLDLVPDDPRKYRVAIIESFRRHGIYRSVRTLSTESFCWSQVLKR